MLALVVGSGGSLESGGRFCVGAFSRKLTSAAEKLFSHLICFINTFNKCTFNVICKDDAAINCIIAQHEKKFRFRQLQPVIRYD
jgi:hypothetical protein